MTKMTVQEALNQVLADIEAMSPEQLQAEHEKHRDGDIAEALRQLSSFAVCISLKERGLMTGIVQ